MTNDKIQMTKEFPNSASPEHAGLTVGWTHRDHFDVKPMGRRGILAIALCGCSVFASGMLFFASAITGGMVHPAKEPLPVGLLALSIVTGFLSASFLIVSIFTKSRSGWVFASIALVISIYAVHMYYNGI